MIPYDAALDLIRGAARTLGTETVAIGQAAGRVLAAPVEAKLSSPARDVSVMDGYAVRDDDLRACPARLRVVGESFAGAGRPGEIGPGECLRVFTGAPIPVGADRVVMQEEVERDGAVALIAAHPEPARYIRRQGSDFRRGDVLLDLGRLLDPRAMVAAAASDSAQVEVFFRPRISILSTGDELAEPGSAAAMAGAIPDSISFGIASLCGAWGGEVVRRQLLLDDLPLMERSAAQAVESADLVVVTGGASVGARDFAKTMFAPLGLELVFAKVAMKPGKPVWFGRVRDRLVIGLPGNPTSALVAGRLLLAPLLAALSGRGADAALRWHKAELDAPLPVCGKRETFHRARWKAERVEPLTNQDSGLQKTLAEAELLVRQRTKTRACEEGERVEVLEF